MGSVSLAGLTLWILHVYLATVRHTSYLIIRALAFPSGCKYRDYVRSDTHDIHTPLNDIVPEFLDIESLFAEVAIPSVKKEN